MVEYGTITDMPRGKIQTKSEVQRTVPKLKTTAARRGRPPKSATKTIQKQAIGKFAHASKPTTAKPKQPARPHQPAIAITVQIPSLRQAKAATAEKIAKPGGKRKLAGLLMVPVIAALVVAGLILMPHFKHGPAAVKTVEAATRTEPDYKPLVLADQKLTTESYDGKRNMVGYTTNFSGVRVTVSEQSLPANFTRDPASLFRAADSIGAKQHIDTAYGTVYVATRDIDSSQMAVFAGKNVLVFIHTDKKMDDVSWKSFVEQLTEKSWNDVLKDTQG
jgi:hypothetical protein